MKGKDILRDVVMAGSLLPLAFLPGDRGAGTPRKSLCRPGDHILLDAPLFQSAKKSSPPIKTDRSVQLNIVLGDVRGDDSYNRVLVERSPDLRSQDKAQPGFLDITSQLDSACTDYQKNKLANRPRGLQPTNDVWPDRIVQVQEQTADGVVGYVTSRIDEVVDDYSVTVEYVDENTGKVITKTVPRSSLYMEPLESSENPYTKPGQPKP